MKLNRPSFILGILPWIIMTFVVFPRLWFAADNLRMIEVSPLGRDEGFLGGTLWGGWKTGAPIFFSIYGFFYSNIFWVFAKISSFVLPVTEQLTIVFSRGISLVSYISLGLLSYFWLRQKQGVLFAVIYSLLLFLVSKDNDFIIRTTSIQTDLLNFVTILLSFFAILHLADKFTVKRLLLVSFFLGMMMAVKFSAFLLLPFLLLALFMVMLNRRISPHKAINTINIIFKKTIFFVWTAICIVIVGEAILPTRSIDGEILGLVKTYQLYFFQFFIVSIIYLKLASFISRLVQKCSGSITFIWSSLTLSIFISTFTFALFSSKSLFKLDFLTYFFYHQSQQLYFHSLFSEKIDIIFNQGLGLFLFSLFLGGSVYSLFKLRQLIIPLVWSWSMIFFFIFVSKGFDIRYIYIFYPPVIYIATVAVIDLYSSISNQKRINKHISNGLLAIFIGVLLIRSYQIIVTQLDIRSRQYTCLECISGVQAGRWLDKNFPDNKTKILQETSVYIPSRFPNLIFFPWGDPYPPFNAQDPDVIFLSGIHIRTVLSLENNDIDLFYRVAASKYKKFLSDLYDHKLPYHKAAVFGSEKDGNDIIVFVRDGIEI